ncbi:hypothetical protein ACWDV4_19380 [Micromonospora sp. NPDC003197]
MDVQVLDVGDQVPLQVTFACAVGVAAGVWRDAEAPAAGQLIDVEWDISDALRWGKSARLATEDSDFVGIVGDAVMVRGRIEQSADGDEVVIMRIGRGLVAVKIVGVLPHLAGCWIELRATGLELYPTAI